jgi:two-component system nitrogen regulation response regulator GlnG
MSTNLNPDNPILIVDDEESAISSISNILESIGLTNIIGCKDSREVMGIISKKEIEVILLDLSMPHIPGADLLVDIHNNYPQVPVIIVTGTDDLSTAVDCMKAGAFDYMVKVVEPSRLISGVKRAIENRKLRREYSDLKEKLIADDLKCPEVFSGILTQNQKMRSIFLFVESIAKTKEPVLITGETGVGKNLIAKAIHDVSGREGPFKHINVAGFDDPLFADNLFGRGKNVVTGAVDPRNGLLHEAGGGTLFLDEIGDLSITSQIKLLQVLDTGEYYPLGSDLAKRSDARIVVATNRNLDKLMDSEKFRRDLYFRLSTYEIRVPPLRERKEDLPILLRFFLEEAARELGKEKTPQFPPELLTLLNTYHFPGNIRELRKMIFYAMSKHKSGTLSLDPFYEAMGIEPRRIPPPKMPKNLLGFGKILPTWKEGRMLIAAEAMKRTNGNGAMSAKLLGVSHQGFNRWLIKNKEEFSKYYPQ